MAIIWIGFLLLLVAAVAGLDDGYGGGPEYGYGAAPAPHPSPQPPPASGEKSGNQQAPAFHRPAVVSSDSGKKSGAPSVQPALGLAIKPDMKPTPMTPVQQARMAPVQSPSAQSKTVWGMKGRQQAKESGKPKKAFNPKKIVGPVIGGIAGAATLAGVIAISAMKKLGNSTKSDDATQPVETVEGSITLQVPDAKSFASDMVAQKAVAAGIADAAGVKPEYVVLTANSIRRLQAIQTPQLVQLKYKVVIPPADTTHSAAVVDKQLAAQSASDIAKAVQGRLSVAKGPSYSIAVTQYAVDKHPAVTPLPMAAHSTLSPSTQAPKPAVVLPPVQATHPPVAQTTKPAKQKLQNPFEMIKAAFAKAKPLKGKEAPAQVKVTPPEVKSTPSQEKPAMQAKKAAPAKQTPGQVQSLPQVVFTTTTVETTTTTSSTTLASNLGAAPLAITTSTSIVAPAAGSSGSSSSSGFHNSFMAGGISIAWVVVACGVAGFFLFRKKKRPKKKPSQETFMPDERDYGRDYGNNTYDEQPLMKEQTALSAPDMESQYLPQESQYMQVQPHYAGQPNLPAPPPAYAEFQPGLPAPPPAPVPQAAPGWRQSPLAVSHVPQLNDYAPQLSLPMTTPNGLIGMNLPPTMYG